MSRHRKTLKTLGWLGVVVAAFGLLAACGDDDDDTGSPTPGTATPTATPAGTLTPGPGAAIPPEVRNNDGDWPLPNADYRNTRYATNSTINSSNIDQLGLAWTVPVTGSGRFGAIATNPVVAGGTVYYQDLSSNVYAVDAESGELVWKNEIGRESIGPNGVAAAYGSIYYISGMDTLVAADAETGDELWSVPVPVSDIEGVDIQLIAYNGMILGSSVPGNAEGFYQGGARGILYAFDAENGDVVWSLDTIDSQDLWGNPDVNSGGGAWYSPAIDIGTGMTFWGIGNPAPYPGTEEFPNGTSRPGPNLYTNSMLAVGPDGNLEWYNQVKPHDLFDLDFQSSPILTTEMIDGSATDVVIGSGKTGRVVAFDRATGETLWDTPVGDHMNDTLDELPEGETEVLPGTFGGVETPLAYHDGTVFAPVLNWSTIYTPSSLDHEFDPGHGHGELVALDASSGNVLWTAEQTNLNFGGATVVNDLVFTATYDGTIYAYDIETGDEVWSLQAPTGINAWPAVVGDTIYWPAGVGQNPMLIALRLGANQPFPTPQPTATATPENGATEQVTISAENIEFSAETVTVAAGAQVTVTFENHDNLPHNFAVYNDDSAADPIFVGDIITGPDEQWTASFTAPTEPGEYFFRCDVHPNQMTGTFVVQ